LLNLSGKAESKSSSKPAPSTRKTKQEKREIAGVGALAALGIFDTGQWGWNLVAPAIALGGLGLLIKNFFRYRRGPFTERTVADLLAEIKVSPVRPVPATIEGKIIGRGVPGLLYSEDFVVRDSTGILFLDYQQPLVIWNFLFGLLRPSKYQNTTVRVTGWFRRATVPYFEILRLARGFFLV